MLRVCENCEAAVANYLCLDCKEDVSTSKQATFAHFCSECSELHSRLRQFKDHQRSNLMQAFHRQGKKCCNCEEAGSKFFCLDCEEADRYLCLGCSIIHPKIKSFRNHRTIVINNQQSEAKLNKTIESEKVSSGSLADVGKLPTDSKIAQKQQQQQQQQQQLQQQRTYQLSSLIDVSSSLLNFQLYMFRLVEDVRQSSVGSQRFLHSAAQLLALLLSYFLLIKHLFGRNSTIIHLLLIVGFVLSNYFQQSQLKEEEKKIFADATATNRSILHKHHPQPLTLRPATSMMGLASGRGVRASEDVLRSFAEEFPEEFSYEKRRDKDKDAQSDNQGRRVSFRPRTRPYVPRKQLSKRWERKEGEEGESDE